MSKMNQLVMNAVGATQAGRAKLKGSLIKQWTKQKTRQFMKQQDGAGVLEYIFIGFVAAVLIIGIYTLINGELPAFVKSIFGKFTSI